MPRRIEAKDSDFLPVSAKLQKFRYVDDIPTLVSVHIITDGCKIK
jgi:hypothetical protein